MPHRIAAQSASAARRPLPTLLQGSLIRCCKEPNDSYDVALRHPTQPLPTLHARRRHHGLHGRCSRRVSADLRKLIIPAAPLNFVPAGSAAATSVRGSQNKLNTPSMNPANAHATAIVLTLRPAERCSSQQICRCQRWPCAVGLYRPMCARTWLCLRPARGRAAATH